MNIFLENALAELLARHHIAEVAKRMRGARDATLPLGTSVKELVEAGRER